jgi:diamine N-acetyltransferase
LEESKSKLHKLYLLPSYHGKGIGKALLQEVARRMREAGQQSLTLNVNKDNQKAIDFYRSQGFVEVYKEVIDIGNGFVMDDVVMELNF